MLNVFSPFKSLFTDNSISLDVLLFSILLIIIPIFLITGPAIPDILLSLIAFYFLIKSVTKKLWVYYKNPIVFGFLFFCIYGVIRSFLSEIPFESLTNEGSVFFFRYIFFAMGFWYLLDKNPHLSKCLLNILVLCILIVGFDGVFQYLFGVNIFGYEKYNNYRLTGLFSDEPIIGRYIAYLSLFTFALIFQNYKETGKMILLSISFLVMCELIVLLSGERTPFFYTSLFLILIILFLPNYKVYRISGIVIIILLIVGIFQFNPNAKVRMVDMTIAQINESQIPYLPYTSSHEVHYISSLKMFSNNPFFGIGTNTFRFQCNKPDYSVNFNSCATHPHNYYIQALAELGIVGFLFIFIFFLYLTQIGVKQIFFISISNKTKQKSFKFLLFPMILFIYFFPLVPHMSLYNNWNNVMIMLPLGYFMKCLYGKLINGNSDKL